MRNRFTFLNAVRPKCRETGHEVRRHARARVQPSPSASTVRYNITGKPPDKPSILIVPSMSYVAVRGTLV